MHAPYPPPCTLAHALAWISTSGLLAGQPPLDVSTPVFTYGSNTVTTDEFGNAKFMVSFGSAPHSGSYAVYCETGGVKSKKSTGFSLTNPIRSVNVTLAAEGGTTDSTDYSFYSDQFPATITIPALKVYVGRFNMSLGDQSSDPAVQTTQMLETMNWQARASLLMELSVVFEIDNLFL